MNLEIPTVPHFCSINVPESRHPLDPIFAPRNVALIGATEMEGSVGRALLENLASFPGSVFPINPNHATVLGKKTYPNISSVPERIDLAVIATPAVTVPKII